MFRYFFIYYLLSIIGSIELNVKARRDLQPGGTFSVNVQIPSSCPALVPHRPGPGNAVCRQVPVSRQAVCPVPKAGAEQGEATMFQERWVHGKTGACGFKQPTTSHGDALHLHSCP